MSADSPGRTPHTQFRVREARFVRSAPSLATLGPPEGAEIAFLGRSNVGKSSLLGILLERPKLVRVSREPGRTRDINLFHLEILCAEGEHSETRIVTLLDLPGYGYAKASMGERERMSRLLTDFVAQRPSLNAVCHLFDSRHAPSAEDLRVHQVLASRGSGVLRVATKSDKLALSRRASARKALAQSLGCRSDDIVLFSAETRAGREEIWRRAWSLLP